MSFSEIKQWIIGIFFGVFSVLLVALPGQGVKHLFGTVCKELPQTSADFMPMVRFVLTFTAK